MNGLRETQLLTRKFKISLPRGTSTSRANTMLKLRLKPRKEPTGKAPEMITAEGSGRSQSLWKTLTRSCKPTPHFSRPGTLT